MERKIIYHENSEEYKAIKLLEQKTKNYSLDGNDLHYALILYKLIVNLSIENQQLQQQCKKQKEVIDKAVNDIQEIIDAVNKNTIIAMKQFNFKLEIIQDELSGSNDILKGGDK